MTVRATVHCAYGSLSAGAWSVYCAVWLVYSGNRSSIEKLTAEVVTREVYGLAYHNGLPHIIMNPLGGFKRACAEEVNQRV